jgi:thiol-disulfide isomerase/thioredoxin
MGAMNGNNTHIKKTDDEGDGLDHDRDFDVEDEDDDLLDDDPAVEAFRNRRLAELKKAQMKHAENMSKGHGDYRLITQDEFLPECTGSDFVAVHFFHNDFEKCKIMDHHLQPIAKRHTTCKFLRINAEKTPFFVAKLQIQTLPTLIIFRNGKTVERLVGFEGLSDNPRKPDEFRTSRLQVWLASTGAIQYDPNEESEDEEEDEDGVSSRFRRLAVTHAVQSRYTRYDEDT